MLCPFKFGRYKFEGGEECHKDCAWRVSVDCAVAVIANDKIERKSVIREWGSVLNDEIRTLVDEQGKVTP